MRARSSALAAVVLLALAGALSFFLLPRPESAASASPVGPLIPVQDGERVPAFVDLRSAEADATPAPERVEVRGEAEPPAASEPLVRMATLLGRVVDPSGLAIADAELKLVRRGLSTHSDADGRFRLVQVTGKGPDTPRDELAVVADGFARLERDVTLSLGEQDLGDIVLAPGGRVSGRVLDPRGVGLEGASVVAIDAQDARPELDVSGPWNRIVETKTDAQGRFLLRGVPVGELRVTAGKEGFYWSTSEPIDLGAREEHRDLELTLAPVPNERWIVLRVIDPGGQPVPNARIDWSYRSSQQSGSSNGEADERGEYRLAVLAMGPHAFTAHDPQERYRPASVENVAPGTRGLVLQLGERRELVLTARDREGELVKSYQARIYSAGSDRAELDEELGGKDGRATLSLPGEAFMVSVGAEGFDLLEQGPFQPESAPEALEVVLVRLPGIRGIVRRAGKPLRGARVGLHEAAGESRLVVNGFLSRSRINAAASGSTDSDGRFTLTLRQAGRFYLRADSEGLAPAEIGPLDLDPAIGAQELELALGAGGAIEGRVLMPPGESPANVIVGISRADGKAVTARSDSAGRFRFERLTPGEWFVTRSREEISPNRTSSSWGGEAPEKLPFNCAVREGKVTRFDLDLTALRKLTIEGRLQLGGKPAAGWRVLLQGQDMQEVSEREPLDSGGRFAITTDSPGEYWMRFLPPGEPGGPTLATQVVLESERDTWERDVPVGSISGSLASWLHEEGSVGVEWDGEGMHYRGGIEHDASGRFRLDPAPAGELRFQHWKGESQQLLKMVTLTAGASLAVDLP